VLYCHPWKKWLVWDGQRWKVDDVASVARFTVDAIRGLYKEAAVESDTSERKKLADFAASCENGKAIRDIVSLAEIDARIIVLPQDLDRDPWLLNVENGVLDLRTGELRPHRPAALLTKLAPVEFDPAAKCPLWMKFLETITCGDADLAGYLQKAAGMSLTGVVLDHVSGTVRMASRHFSKR
jgi:putative DNA primase/helicase